MPRCYKAQNNDIHEAITEQNYQIAREIEMLRLQNQEQSISPSAYAERIKKLESDCETLLRQSATLYDQFVVSKERLQQMHIAYGRLAQISLV
ncbi:hypothetical protein TWF696_007427 [Orbilia brochopaga]|uniref:Uncharacterized protein n=1 Tax=Orbilia brochopaga TaxID=3140254 RepID=A0AAV9USR8_9PEZI